MEAHERYRQAIDGRELSLAACSEAGTIKDGQYQWRRALIWNQLAMSFVGRGRQAGETGKASPHADGDALSGARAW
jgi:hypothetical protein